MSHSAVHVIALVKGAVEGDPFKHLGLPYQLADIIRTEATRLGLIDDLCQPTPLGRSFYIDANLASLPAGRARYWGAAALRAQTMLRELERQGS